MNYKIVNGTYYNEDTPDKVIAILENSRLTKKRILIVYGDVKKGTVWDRGTPERGHVGRSTGNIKIPLLIRTSRSLGGTALLDNCIIKILESRGGALLYERK